MGHRPHAYASIVRPTHRGNEPNTFYAAITAEIRVFWTPTTSSAEILRALDDAYREALGQIDGQPDSMDIPRRDDR